VSTLDATLFPFQSGSEKVRSALDVGAYDRSGDVPRGSELKLVAQKEKNHARKSSLRNQSPVGRVECFYFDPLPASNRRVSQSLLSGLIKARLRLWGFMLLGFIKTEDLESPTFCSAKQLRQRRGASALVE
jgi:hypothetical protein